MVGQQQNAKITDFSADWRAVGTQKIPRVGWIDESEVGEISILDFNLQVQNIEIFIPIFSHDTIQPIDRPRKAAYFKDARHGIYIHNNSQIH